MAIETNTRNLHYIKILFGLMFAIILLPSNLKAIAILLFGLGVLSLQIRRKSYFDLKFFIVNAAIFFILLFTIFYSSDLQYGMRKLSTMSSLLVFPLIFSMLNKEEIRQILQNTKYYLWTYIIAVFLFNIIPFIWFWTTHYTFSEMMQHFGTVMQVDVGKYGVHPIYLSMHCALAILFSLFLLFRNFSKKSFFLLAFIDLCFLFFLLVYAKKGPLISLILVFSLFVAFQGNRKLVKPYLIAVFAVISLIILIPKTRSKFSELVKIENVSEGQLSSTNIRYTIYEKAVQVIEEAPVFGYGIGDYRKVLTEKYKEDHEAALYHDQYNSHNQYLSFLLMGGIVLLIVFGFVILLNMIYAIRFDNQILILVLIFYAFNMLTENILEREDGVIFFSFFLCFFAMGNRQKAAKFLF